ncbi:MAG: hypothetical protein ABFS39_12355 [Pseudomonadota bacterium]
MEIDKRTGQSPIPSSPSFFLNNKQLNGMEVLKKFGWELTFIRRPLYSEVIPVVQNNQEQAIGVLGIDGVLKISDEIKIRGSNLTN